MNRDPLTWSMLRRNMALFYYRQWHREPTFFSQTSNKKSQSGLNRNPFIRRADAKPDRQHTGLC
ncbi:MAG TPA: hypothetical protein VJM53_04805 [Burkholderiales bacterium]|nr:hypothetical protein [Burkholderiales bacterium]